MNKHDYLVKMFTGCQFTKDIGALYFPQFKCLSPRMEAFRRTIEDTPGMYARMKQKGYTDNCEFLSPQLIAILVELCGWPDEVLLQFPPSGAEK